MNWKFTMRFPHVQLLPNFFQGITDRIVRIRWKNAFLSGAFYVRVDRNDVYMF